MTRSPNRLHDRTQLYKYVASDTAAKILATRALRWSAPTRFNDAFDVARSLAFDFTSIDLHRAMEEAFIAVVEGREYSNNPGVQQVVGLAQNILDPTMQAAFLAEIRRVFAASRPDKGRVIDEFDKAWQELLPRLRILCLSEVPDSSVMWSRYAAEYSGAVLTFRADDDLDSSLLRAEPVIYTDTAPSLPPVDVWARYLIRNEAPPWDEWLKAHHYAKTSNWAYEREWRVITYQRPEDSGDYSDWQFHPQELEAVTLGPHVKASDAQLLATLVATRYPGTKLQHAILDHGTRSIRIQDFRDPRVFD